MRQRERRKLIPKQRDFPDDIQWAKTKDCHILMLTRAKIEAYGIEIPDDAPWACVEFKEPDFLLDKEDCKGYVRHVGGMHLPPLDNLKTLETWILDRCAIQCSGTPYEPYYYFNARAVKALQDARNNDKPC